MKIIAGEIKNQPLKVPLHIRPASSRLKKGLFDLLQDEIRGKSVLDAFAGSGSLGIEALSRGARTAVFVDINKSCIKTVAANLEKLRLISRSELIIKDVSRALRDFYGRKKTFEVILFDPPYHRDMAKKALQTIGEYDILAPSGYLVIIGYRTDEIGYSYKKGILLVARNYGQSKILIYRKVSAID